MALTFSELGKLERLLVTEGAWRDASTELNATAEWSRAGKVGGQLKEMLVRLAETARKADNRRAAEIALGSLVFARREFERDEGRCLAILRFAQQRVDSLESDNIYWANVILSEDDEEDARALFEAAIGDSSYSTGELIESANKFINRYQGENSIFGRLAADLATLLDVVKSEKPSQFAEIARAALTYFTETADAIPDDLGLVGLLDDAYIVQQAVEQICPDRACLTSYLEDRVRAWPFLRNLKFAVNKRPIPISDYMLVNSALLLDVLEPEARSAVVLVADAGPLPYLMGFVAALSRVSAIAESHCAALKRGDRLMDRDGKGEVVFNRYLRQEGESFTICEAELATHAQVVHPSRGRMAEVLRTIPVVELGNFRRTAVGVDKRKRSSIKVDVGNREVGPLEQLFGTSSPIMLDPYLPVVLVVAPIANTRRLAEKLEVFGATATNVIPTGHLRRVEDGFEIEHWSTYGIGGEPMLGVVRSVDEAHEAIVSSPFENRPPSTVVAVVRPNSPDASQLARIADAGVGVLAFVAPEDSESLEVLSDRNMSFWSWDAEWFGLLYWPGVETSTGHPVVAYERHLRQRLHAANKVEIVRFDELSELAARLVTMGQDPDDDNEPLMDWVTRAWWLLLRMCRWLTPVTRDVRDEFTSSIDELAALLRANIYRWSKESLDSGKKLVELFECASTALGECNPKYVQLRSLASNNPGTTILVAERDRARVVEALHDADVHVVSRNVSSEDAKLRIIPAWYGQSRMETLAFATTFEQQTLLLYEPESEWFTRAKQRRDRAISKTKELVGQHTAIPIGKREESSEQREPDGGSRFGDVDQALKNSIYSFVNRKRRESDDLASATVVGFVGGSWAAFTAAHRIVVVSHLIDATGEDTEVASAYISDLRVGDIVLLIHGSDRDAVRERANRSLSEEVIRAAGVWKRALRTYVHVNPNLEELRQRLSRANCVKSAQTIKAWISGNHVIGPQHADAVIPAIAEAIGSTELREHEKECLTAIGLVRSAHVTAGKWLSNRVVERAREWTEAGATPDDLVELEDRLVLATIDFIDGAKTEVPASIVNRLQSSTWHA